MFGGVKTELPLMSINAATLGNAVAASTWHERRALAEREASDDREWTRLRFGTKTGSREALKRMMGPRLTSGTDVS
jgi:hypothetical protein